MSCSTSTPSVMRPGSVSSSRFSYKHLDDDDGARQRAGDAEIERVELAAAHRQPDPAERTGFRAGSRRSDCPPAANQDDLAGAHDLFQVDFEPDHEQHEDQAELGDDGDRLLRT